MNERSTLTRRRLLATAGSVGAVTALAGCIGGPAPYTRLAVDIAESFDADPPVTVPLTVEALVQNVDSKDVALRDVELVCADETGEELATEALGDLTWRDADSDRREQRDHDSWWVASVTSYRASWTFEPELDLPEVPVWLTFRLADVWFGDEETDTSMSGTAAASSPAPRFEATLRVLEVGGEDRSTVEPTAYHTTFVEKSNELEAELRDGTALLLPGDPARGRPGASQDGESGDGRNETTSSPPSSAVTTLEPTPSGRLTRD